MEFEIIRKTHRLLRRILFDLIILKRAIKVKGILCKKNVLRDTSTDIIFVLWQVNVPTTIYKLR